MPRAKTAQTPILGHPGSVSSFWQKRRRFVYVVGFEPMAEPKNWTTVALLPMAAGLGIVLLEAVRQIETPTTRALVAGGGLVATYLLGLATRAGDLRLDGKKPGPKSGAGPSSTPPPR